MNLQKQNSQVDRSCQTASCETRAAFDFKFIYPEHVRRGTAASHVATLHLGGCGICRPATCSRWTLSRLLAGSLVVKAF